MSQDILSLSLSDARDALRSGELGAIELTETYNAAVETLRPLNAFITETPELALEMAKASEVRLAANEGGAMEGIPIGMKDLFCTEGVRTSCASRMLDRFIAPYDATVVKKLHAEAGMVMLGKCNMDEFAMGSSNETSWYGPVKNPWDLNRVPGGSSGGSVAAVAAGLAPVATATDTGL